MLRLILENKELELDENIQFAITRQFEDITNPTTIINDWSKTVRIPSTPNNDKIFGHIFSVDKTIVEGSNKLGIYFNPYKKIDFRLVDDSNVILTGYAKNISVDKDYYNLTLNGELGKVFQEMKKITFDTKTEDTKYLIDGSKYVKEQINKDTIYKSWTNESSLTMPLYEITDSRYKLEDVIGFAPNNSFDEGFDYKTFQLENQNISKTFTEVLNEKAGGKYEDETGIAADTVIGNGLLPREIGEYRSYLQQPYIFFNKLFQIFTKKTEEITGYSVNLHPNWFNEGNPYWMNLVYFLKKFDQKKSNSDENYYEFYGNPIKFYPNLQEPILYDGSTVYRSSIIENIPRINRENWTFNVVDGDYVYNRFKCKMMLSGNINGNINSPITFNEDNCLIIKVNLICNTPQTKTIIVYNIDTKNEVIKNLYQNADIPYPVAPEPDGDSDNGAGWTINFETIISETSSLLGPLYGIQLEANWLNNNNPFNAGDEVTNVYLELQQGQIYSTVTENYNRSFRGFILNDLWDNEYSIFDVILDYCKRHRIGVFTDYYNKELKFIPLSEYFKDFTIEDWTDKVDYSRDFHIEPITFQNRYILFNYNNPDTELNKLYQEKYGVNYGEFKLTTDYEFNNDVKSLFEHSKTAIPYTDTVKSWTSLYDKLNIVYTVPAEISINNRDKDKKNVNIFGGLAFYKGLSEFDDSLDLRNVKITDDTDLQISTQTYFYTQVGQKDRYIDVTTYPLLDISYSSDLSTYTTPVENYSYHSETGNKGLYDNFWKHYLDERYNIQNKIVTCYVYLKPNEFADFKFNKFVKINNQLYFVNKIYDYDIDATTPTKVDLITVQDIEGYTKNEFDIFNIYLKIGDRYQLYDGNLITIPQHSGMTIYITSLEDVYWSADSGIQNNLEINGEVGYGVISKGGKVPVYLYNDEYGPVRGYIEFNNGKEIQKIYVNVE